MRAPLKTALASWAPSINIIIIIIIIKGNAAGNVRSFGWAIPHSTCIVMAAIFDFITEEEWGERGRLRGGGGAKQPTVGNKIV